MIKPHASIVLIAVGMLSACVATSMPGDPSPESWEPSAEASRPNVVLVLFEDMSPRVGAFGDSLAHTPNFDRIASEGVKYTRVFTTSGVCAPSRAALITGHYQHTIGAQHMRTTNMSGLPTGGPQNYLAVPAADIKAFPETLRLAGYHTSNQSKTDYQFGEPFTIWDESGDYADWDGRASDQPFFHMRTFFNTHESTIWPLDMTPTNPVEQFLVSRNNQVFADREDRVSPDQVKVPPYLPDTPEVRQDIATHYNNIAFTDVALGQLYDRLAEEGLLDNTILIVSTDHGDGLPRMKRSLYDSGLHVPMVIRYPNGWGAGSTNEELISFVDLAPTILSWTGETPAATLHGRDFAGSDRDAPRDYVFAAQDRMDNEVNRRRAVRDERYKYIRNFIEGDPYFVPLAFRDSQPSMKALWAAKDAATLPSAAARLFKPLPYEQLYDTESDPHEVNNLAGEERHQATLERLRGELDRWLEAHGDLSSKPEIEMIRVMWPNGEQPITAPVQSDISVQGDQYVVRLTSATPGASIGYRFGGEDGVWQIYRGPLRLGIGSTFEVKAIRYGYAESEVGSVNVPD